MCRYAAHFPPNIKAWTTIGVSACLGLGACGDSDTATEGASASDSNNASSSGSQTTTQGSNPTTASTTADAGSDSQDADSTPTSTVATIQPRDRRHHRHGVTTGPETGTHPAVNPSDGDDHRCHHRNDRRPRDDPGSTGTTPAAAASLHEVRGLRRGPTCAAKACVPFDGDCVDNADCHGDIFCCAKNCLPQGEALGVHIDFGLDPEGDAHED